MVLPKKFGDERCNSKAILKQKNRGSSRVDSITVEIDILKYMVLGGSTTYSSMNTTRSVDAVHGSAASNPVITVEYPSNTEKVMLIASGMMTWFFSLRRATISATIQISKAAIIAVVLNTD